MAVYSVSQTHSNQSQSITWQSLSKSSIRSGQDRGPSGSEWGECGCWCQKGCRSECRSRSWRYHKVCCEELPGRFSRGVELHQETQSKWPGDTLQTIHTSHLARVWQGSIQMSFLSLGECFGALHRIFASASVEGNFLFSSADNIGFTAETTRPQQDDVCSLRQFIIVIIIIMTIIYMSSSNC